MLAHARDTSWWTPLALALLVTACTLLAMTGGPSTDSVVVTGLINLLVVIGLYIFIGCSGVFSFGHVAFMAIGAYVAALTTIPSGTRELLYPDLPGVLSSFEMSPFVATLAAGIVAGVAAIAFAPVILRLSGLRAALATFALLTIVNVVASNWKAVTNGTTGISGIPLEIDATEVLLCVLVALAAAWAFQESRAGLRLRASREDEVAASAVGIEVGRLRAIAFILSTVVVGSAGALYAQSLGTVTPGAFALDATFLTLAMLVIGGMKSLSGATIGGIVVSVVAELLRRIEQESDLAGLQEIALGALLLAMLIWRPNGLTGGREVRWRLPRLGRRGARVAID
jgi:branched-chain amino acid transport system permease protein